MADILSVAVGDRFSSQIGNTLQVIKIWVEFVHAEKSWEVFITWKVEGTLTDSLVERCQNSGKCRAFVQALKEGNWVRAIDSDESLLA